MIDDAVNIHSSLLVFNGSGMLRYPKRLAGDTTKFENINSNSCKGLIRCTKGRVRTIKKQRTKLKSLLEGLDYFYSQRMSPYVNIRISESSYNYLKDLWVFEIRKMGFIIYSYSVSLRALELKRKELENKGEL